MYVLCKDNNIPADDQQTSSQNQLVLMANMGRLCFRPIFMPICADHTRQLFHGSYSLATYSFVHPKYPNTPHPSLEHSTIIYFVITLLSSGIEYVQNCNWDRSDCYANTQLMVLSYSSYNSFCSDKVYFLQIRWHNWYPRPHKHVVQASITNIKKVMMDLRLSDKRGWWSLVFDHKYYSACMLRCPTAFSCLDHAKRL